MKDSYIQHVVELGDNASKMLFEGCKATWSIREGLYGEVNADEDNFRGERHWSLAPLLEVPHPEGLQFDQQADGIGTKVIVSQRSSSYAGAGHDLLAMADDDAAAKGYEPVLVTTVLDVNRFTDANKPYANELAQGAVAAARRSRVALYGGETAVLGNIVGGYGSPSKHLHFSWSATTHAVGHADRVIDGSRVRPGMAVVGMYEPGLRSNGITKARDVLAATHGRMWHNERFETETEITTLGQAVVQGSVIYTPVLVDAIGGYDLRVAPRAAVHGAAHITGGGMVKLAEMLGVSGYGADIYEPYQPPEIMKEVLRCAGIPDRVAYSTLHMGMGMAVVTDEPDKFIETANLNDVDAKVIGEVTKEPGVVARSAGLTAPGRKLRFAA